MGERCGDGSRDAPIPGHTGKAAGALRMGRELLLHQRREIEKTHIWLTELTLTVSTDLQKGTGFWGAFAGKARKRKKRR